MPGGRPTGLLPSGVAFGRGDGDAPGVPGSCMGRAGEAAMLIAGMLGVTANVDMDGGAMDIDMGIDTGIDMGIEPGYPPPIIMTGAFAFGIGTTGDGEPKAPGEPAGNAGVADMAGDPAIPAEPNLARDDGSGLCEAPTVLETIIL